MFPANLFVTATSSLDYKDRIRDMNNPLRLLTENEIYRLLVWGNPTGDPKRWVDHPVTYEKSQTEVVLWS